MMRSWTIRFIGQHLPCMNEAVYYALHRRQYEKNLAFYVNSLHKYSFAGQFNALGTAKACSGYREQQL